MKRMPDPEPLDAGAFAPFGKVLRRAADGEPFQDLHTASQSNGWRVALLDAPAGPMRRLHRHPDSEECFAPLWGDACIAVAEPEAPERWRLFRLDEPVCIHRNTWHEVVSREPTRVFIAENAEISGEEYPIDPVEW